jgi:lipoate-protein ligase A
MSDQFPCRVLQDGPLPGPVNMAVDEALLNAATQGIATLRFYQWDTPTVSIGHFQAREGGSIPARFRGLVAVRRLSGGGAILHHRELTYSCALPATHPLTADPGQIYDRVHEAIINVLSQHGIASRMRGKDAFADQSFLCFSRGDARDIVIGSNKIVGSAQRRRQGAVLQHGSILLSLSPETPEFPGIVELSGVKFEAEELAGFLLPVISESLGLEPSHQPSLTPEETRFVEQQAPDYLVGPSDSTVP